MARNETAVRQSVTLPARVAKQIRNMAKRRRLSANRMLVELVEEGIELQKQKEKTFFELAERFRSATDPAEIQRLGDQLGQMVFSNSFINLAPASVVSAAAAGGPRSKSSGKIG